ncbi:type IV secretion protein Rhs [Actinoplanes cyaneus]|uniref:Type IV secretion protein Rhs n=1 Tax=Actinoplanes cyaneus TaxID=52696 RepID=A0A919IXZ2_9ACTN|nr:RHS repeat-associated core domain-containing protein [Actinoplanes cyaneus]GID70135.1 type IV secretion protein Rhs [Actinoplanes cyaneus]
MEAAVTGRALLTAGLAIVLSIGVAGNQPAYAAVDRTAKLTAPDTPSVAPGKAKPAAGRPADPAGAAALRKAPAVTWPAASDTVVAAPAGRRAVAVTGTPVSVGAAAASSVRVRILGHDAAVRAKRDMLIEVSRTAAAPSAGPVDVAVDYASFRSAYGADWAGRLHLVQVPGCATTTPDAAACQPVAVPSRNDPAAAQVTATVTLAATAQATTLALTSGSSGNAGDFTATPLKASSTWSGGNQSGDFTWSYPMRVPPSQGGPEPAVALNYSSASVDGEMAASNNQPGWIGEGFSYQPGSIVRNYKACAEDMGGTATNKTKTGDLCWGTANATLSMPGHAGELVRDDGDGHWSLKGDDGSKVQLLTGATNGDNDGEYWKVTTADGTQYFFGLNHLAGWATGNPVTNAAYTVPVFGNNSGEPCYNATFASASCSQAYEWNLDYVVDPHGDTMSLWYTPETNKYARNLTSSSISTYTRGGYLSRIDYGTDQHTGGKDSDLTTKAPNKVDFTPADRCVTAGTTCVSSTPSNWPDVPWDQSCTSTTSCKDYAPTFFSQKRLDTVQTSVWNASTSEYVPVEKWTLHQTYPDPGDSTRAGLWLSSISHTGLYGGTATLPDVSFTGVQKANRVDTATDNAAKMNWWRIASITTETGDLIGVTYSDQECTAGSTPTPDANTANCYPVFWTRAGETNPRIDWFNKYRVTAVSENDQTGGGPRVRTTYDYGTPAWHYDEDNGLVPATRKTWGQFRGYDTVTTTTGDTGDPRSSTTVRYFLGMNGDKTSSGTRAAQVTDSTGATVADDDAYAGMTRETIVRNGPGGAEVSGEIDDPWKSAAVATRTINGRTVAAYRTGIAATHSRTDLDGGRSPRRTEKVDTLDVYGMTTQVWDKGDLAKSDDDTCTITTYNRNTTVNLLDTVGRTQEYAKPCGTAPATQDDVISDVESSFDGQAYGVAPTKGDITREQTAKAWTTSSITWLTTAASVYDAYGRVTDATDVRGNHSLTEFTPATGGPVTATKTTKNPLGWVTTAEIAPGYGVVTASVDENNKRTDTTYDPFGRKTAIWKPTRSKSAGATANTTFAYQISQTAPSVVTTSNLDASATYVPVYAFYDGLLRERQTQELATGGGRTVSDVFYDSLGQTVKESGPYYNAGAPGTTLFPAPIDQNVPAQTLTTYDGAGREIRSAFVAHGVTQWHTTTAYGGDRVDVTPAADAATPTAGTPTSTVTDALDHMVELRRYTGTTVSGTYESTKYTYNEKGEQTVVTDNGGSQWRYAFDLLGRTVSSTDPDSGTTTTAYDDAGDVTSTTDALNRTVSYDYTLPAGYADPLGRRTATWLGAAGTGTRTATWTYDTLAKGHLTSSSRFVGTDEYKSTVIGYNNLYQRAGTITTIPASEGALAGTYGFSATYNLDGTMNSKTLPATGDVPAETLNYSYDQATGRPYSLKTDLGGTTKQIVLSTQYTSYGEPAVTTFADSNTAPFAQQALTYDESTHRLVEAKTLKSTASAVVGDVHYSYDALGNITKAADTPAAGTAETQCYTYDGLQRLTDAWTPADGDCAVTPATDRLGGAAPYWKSWTFDGSTGNRKTEVTHTAAATTTVTSAYGQAGHPHAVSGTTSTSGTVRAYTYDAAGNTISRPGTSAQQTLQWDAENHLVSLTEGSSHYTYVYDPDGNRLIAHEPTGTTLYIGDVQLRLSGTGVKTAVRYYSFNNQTVAQRTAAGLQFLSCDPNGTSTIAIDDTAAQNTTKRYQDPYGNAVGPAVSWVGTKSFVGGDQDPTGLIHEGAREYDATLGAFVSRDPVVDQDDPSQLNGFSYAGDNPVVHSDPTGLRTDYYDDVHGNSKPKPKPVTTVHTDPRHAALVRHHAPHARIVTSSHTYSPRKHYNPPPRLRWVPAKAGGSKSHPVPHPTPWGDTLPTTGVPEPGTYTGSFGFCLGGGVGIYIASVSVSGCLMFDDGGSGGTLTVDHSYGLTGGPAKGKVGANWGAGVTWSNGRVKDQAGGFHTKSGGGGYIATGTVTKSTGKKLDGSPETTWNVTIGPGYGVTLTDGDSYTVLHYDKDPD